MTHPGVGALTVLAFVLIKGTWERFPRGKQIGNYVGMIPSEDSSARKQRLGHLSKQGSSLLRFHLVMRPAPSKGKALTAGGDVFSSYCKIIAVHFSHAFSRVSDRCYSCAAHLPCLPAC